PHEFAAAGYPTGLKERAELVRANVEICRRLWSGERVSFKNEYFDFADVALKPAPVKPIPIWYGGGTPAACRRAVEYCDGWMPARTTLPTFAKLVAYSRALCEKAGKPRLTAAVMPFTSVGTNRNDALKDIRGFILAGSPAEIARAARDYENAGADQIVFDLRFRYADWLEQIELLGTEVLPALRN